MKLLGGEMRWLDMSREQAQRKILVEEMRLDDIYHASRLKWRQQYHQPRQQDEEDGAAMEGLVREHPGTDVWMEKLEECIEDVVEEMKSMSLNGGGPTKRYRRGKAKSEHQRDLDSMIWSWDKDYVGGRSSRRMPARGRRRLQENG